MPVEFIVVVDEHERAALEVDTVVGEIQERSVVETAIGLLVDVHMPVLKTVGHCIRVGSG